MAIQETQKQEMIARIQAYLDGKTEWLEVSAYYIKGHGFDEETLELMREFNKTAAEMGVKQAYNGAAMAYWSEKDAEKMEYWIKKDYEAADKSDKGVLRTILSTISLYKMQFSVLTADLQALEKEIA